MEAGKPPFIADFLWEETVLSASERTGDAP